MNKNQKLNTLVTIYRETRDEDVFNEIYAKTIGKIYGKLEKIGKSIRADFHETLALYEDVLLRCIDVYDGKQDFQHFYNSSVSRARTDLYRKKKRLFEREYYEPETEDEDAATSFDFIVGSDGAEHEFIRKQTEADQRQLIGSLIDPGKVNDATTTAIVEAFLASENPNPTAIGRQLGIHHSTVIRKLNRLARNFQPEIFGDRRDYLLA
jgi:DNA-directed RNA polymerase specialized sigma24 family protein